MTTEDKICLALFVLVLVAIGAAMFRGAYQRAHPKSRMPGPFTTVRGGRRHG